MQATSAGADDVEHDQQRALWQAVSKPATDQSKHERWHDRADDIQRAVDTAIGTIDDEDEQAIEQRAPGQSAISRRAFHHARNTGSLSSPILSWWWSIADEHLGVIYPVRADCGIVRRDCHLN